MFAERDSDGGIKDLPPGFRYLTSDEKPERGDFAAFRVYTRGDNPNWLKILYAEDVGVRHRGRVYIRKSAPSVVTGNN